MCPWFLLCECSGLSTCAPLRQKGSLPSTRPVPAVGLEDVWRAPKASPSLRLLPCAVSRADRAAGPTGSHRSWAIGRLAGLHEAGDLPVLEERGTRTCQFLGYTAHASPPCLSALPTVCRSELFGAVCNRQLIVPLIIAADTLHFFQKVPAPHPNCPPTLKTAQDHKLSTAPWPHTWDPRIMSQMSTRRRTK